MRKSSKWAFVASILLASLVLSACQGQQVQVPVTVVVKETQVVEQTSVVKETQVVNQTQVVEVTSAPAGAFTTPHPILSDLKVRQAIAYCTDRKALIKSVFSLPLADGTPPGVYIRQEGQAKSHRPKRWTFTIKGRLDFECVVRLPGR